jgi:hypothetical protein
MRILVVDDTSLAMLLRHRYCVRVCAARNCLTVFHVFWPHVVLLDVGLEEVAAQIKVPLIGLTDGERPAGFCAFVQRPAKLAAVLEALAIAVPIVR